MDSILKTSSILLEKWLHLKSNIVDAAKIFCRFHFSFCLLHIALLFHSVKFYDCFSYLYYCYNQRRCNNKIATILLKLRYSDWFDRKFVCLLCFSRIIISENEDYWNQLYGDTLTWPSFCTSHIPCYFAHIFFNYSSCLYLKDFTVLLN